MVTNPRFMRLWQSLKEKQHEVWALCGAFSNPIEFFRMMHVWWYHFAVGEYSQMAGVLLFCRDQTTNILAPSHSHEEVSVAIFLFGSTSNRQIRRMLGTCVTLGISVCQCFFLLSKCFLFKLRGNFCPWPWHCVMQLTTQIGFTH